MDIDKVTPALEGWLDNDGNVMVASSAFGKNLFMACSGSGRVMKSENGISWTSYQPDHDITRLRGLVK